MVFEINGKNMLLSIFFKHILAFYALLYKYCSNKYADM